MSEYAASSQAERKPRNTLHPTQVTCPLARCKSCCLLLPPPLSRVITPQSSSRPRKMVQRLTYRCGWGVSRAAVCAARVVLLLMVLGVQSGSSSSSSTTARQAHRALALPPLRRTHPPPLSAAAALAAFSALLRRRRHAYATKSNRTRVVKTPGACVAQRPQPSGLLAAAAV